MMAALVCPLPPWHLDRDRYHPPIFDRRSEPIAGMTGVRQGIARPTAPARLPTTSGLAGGVVDGSLLRDVGPLLTQHLRGEPLLDAELHLHAIRPQSLRCTSLRPVQRMLYDVNPAMVTVLNLASSRTKSGLRLICIPGQDTPSNNLPGRSAHVRLWLMKLSLFTQSETWNGEG